MNHFHLRHAVVCLDCDHISDTSGDTCPACGSRGLMNLAAVLGYTQDVRPYEYRPAPEEARTV